ncbi:MAG TPA: prepilin peptidase [Anaerolineae bacterium]|nr:prepilin peptidase [Anaerolineae bacterium]
MGNGIDFRLSLSFVVTTLLLARIAWIDWRTRRIPDEWTLALVIWAGMQLIWPGRLRPSAAVIGLMVGGGGFFLLAWISRGGLGWGDVKLAAGLGALLGFPGVLYGLSFGMIFAGLVAGGLLFTGRAGRKDSFAYGPYLALGGWLVYWISRSFGLG